MTPHEIAEKSYEDFRRWVQDELQTLKSDAPTWQAALDERIAYYKGCESALRTLEAEKSTAEKSIAYWKTCSNCGQPMDAPGLCSVAQHEWQKGQAQMLDETLTRAEKAESALAAAQQQIADLTTWRPAVRELRDAIVQVWGNEEDCDDCGDKSEAGNHSPCAVHASTRLYRAVRGVDEILGPCTCGHPSSRHEDEDTTRCKDCRCDYFQLPAPATDAPR